MLGMGELLLIRHGETAWSRTGQYGGRTDLSLTDAGVAAGRALGPLLARRQLAAVFVSPLSRAVRTAELAGLPDVKPDPDLLEWDYGGYEGMTEEQIRAARPGWDLWRDGCPGGETAAQVGARADLVLAELASADGEVAVFSHGHMLRVLGARWAQLPPAQGARLGLSTAAICVLGFERDRAVLSRWNDTGASR